MASDTIRSELVSSLLSWDWFNLLSISRSDFTRIDSEYVKLEKFSSMGNGYTFELESLIFLAVCRSIVPREEWHAVSVFGDDLIVPQEYASSVIDCLELLGFKTNKQKSFLAGSFFESCGTDWFKGQNVRPFFCKGRSKAGIPYSLQIANMLRLYAKRVYLDGCDPRFRPIWQGLIKATPRSWRLPVPASLGDVGMVTTRPGYIKPAKNGLEGWYVYQMSIRPKQLRKKTFGRLLCALACSSEPGQSRSKLIKTSRRYILTRRVIDDVDVDGIFSNGFEPRRGYLRKPAKKRVLVSTWTDSLCWGSK